MVNRKSSRTIGCPVDLPGDTDGEDPMREVERLNGIVIRRRRVLVIFSAWSGSTVGVAYTPRTLMVPLRYSQMNTSSDLPTLSLITVSHCSRATLAR